MKKQHLARLAVLTFAIGGVATADSFSSASFTPSDSNKQHSDDFVTGKSYLDPSRLPSFASAAASASFDYQKDGYIGTVRLPDSFTVEFSTPVPETAVPEPATLLLFGSGLAAAALRRRHLS